MSVVGTRNLSKLTGWRGDLDYFSFVEFTEFDADPVLDVLRGRRLGVIFRGVIDPAASAELVRRFWQSPARRRRSGEVCESQGFYIGAFHYHKLTKTYLDESAEIADGLDALLDVPGEPSRWFRERLNERLATEGARLRLCAKDGRPGCPVLIRHWDATGDFALQPHEDFSQLSEPHQADFEIQRTPDRVVAAVNMCLQNGAGGRLVIWNVIPDLASRQRLGLHFSGSPYPPEALKDHESIWLEIRSGDIYVFNGGHVHGVEASAPGAKRTTMAWNMGFCDDSTVVSWT
ncbi:MAG: hypothetical protein JO272_03355 [Pseudonocardiales bacterium]|nr:hypothetical protein [Pseudonocardiales bacterium]